MTKYLILTEKPSARRNFEKALGGKSGHFNDFDYTLTNLRGHVLTLAAPEKQVPSELSEKYSKWELEYLPWDLGLFKWQNTYIKEKNPRSGKIESTKGLLDDLKKMANTGNFDAIVIATDTDPSGEGELLAWEAILAIGWSGNVLRANFMDESPKSIQQSFNNLKDVTDFSQDGDFQKGLARSRWDFASMQLTRIATIAAKQQGYDVVARQGRLKSAMLWKIYSQLELIKQYKRVPFYEVRYKDEQGNIYKRTVDTNVDDIEFRYKDKQRADEDLANYQVSGVEVVEQETKYQKPPRLLELSSLSALLSKEGFDAKEVLATYQAMYEDQIVSYPRTEDKTITPEQFAELLPKIDQIASIVGVDSSLLTHREPRATHVKPQGSHGANRPGTNVPNNLNELTQYGPSATRIYEILSRNYLAILAEDYQYQATKARIIEYPEFMTTLNTPIKLNWQAIYNTDEDDDSDAKQLASQGSPFVFEGQNSKPTQPTWTWLKNFLEKNDIGTGATRTSTYAELSSGKQAFIKDTKGKITLTDRGAISAYLVKDTYIADPTITKRVFEIFTDVGKFKISSNQALSSITTTVEHDMPIIIENAKQLGSVFGKSSNSSTVKKYEQKEKATGIWRGREIKFTRTWGSHRFTDEEVTELLEGNVIEFKGRSTYGNEYKVRGKLVEQKYNNKPYIGFKKISEKGT